MSKEDAYFDAKLSRYQDEHYGDGDGPKTCEKSVVLIPGVTKDATSLLEMKIQAEWSQKEPHCETFELIVYGNIIKRWDEIDQNFAEKMFDFANSHISEKDFEK